jgi:hypothetical protein
MKQSKIVSNGVSFFDKVTTNIVNALSLPEPAPRAIPVLAQYNTMENGRLMSVSGNMYAMRN